jgi:hypothetical protein
MRAGAEANIGVWRIASLLLRGDRNVCDLRRLEDALQELPARCISRFLEQRSAFQANVTLAGEGDRDVYGRH